MMEVTKSQGRMVHKCADNLQKRKKFDRGYVCAGYLLTKRKKKIRCDQIENICRRQMKF